MNSALKKMLPVVLIIWPYLFWIPFLLGSEKESLYSVSFLTYIFAAIVICVLNMINACTWKGENAGCQLAFWDMLIKLIHIPFYLLVFCIGVLMLLSMVVPAMVFISPFIIFILFVIDLFLMITSSIYGVNALLRAVKKGMISKQYGVISGILHFFFILDVVSAVCVFIKLKRVENHLPTEGRP